MQYARHALGMTGPLTARAAPGLLPRSVEQLPSFLPTYHRTSTNMAINSR